MHHPIDRITHTMAFVTPVVEHWLECFDRQAWSVTPLFLFVCLFVCFLSQIISVLIGCTISTVHWERDVAER